MLQEIHSQRAGVVPPYQHYSDDEKHAMQRAILNLFGKWEISDADASTLLGGVSSKTLSRWREGAYGRLSVDQADRISNLLAIHKALRILFKDARRYYGWVKKPNEAFGGDSALEIMLHGHLQDIMRVRRYLDAVRGSW